MSYFAYIINTVSETENPGLYKTQRITMDFAISAATQSKHSVTLSCVSNDPAYKAASPFITLPALTRNIRQVNGLEKQAPLPFLKDILGALSQVDAEYLVYTNLDIILAPQFFNAVKKYIDKGHDAIVINRRRVSEKYNHNPDPDLIFSETGKSHTGYDTFIFKKSLLDQMVLKDVCIGVPPAGNDLFYNLFTLAQNPVLYTEKNLTFHIGMELYKAWGNAEILRHNYKEFKKILKELQPKMDISKFPGAYHWIGKRHLKWLMNPTFHYPTMFKTDLSQLGKKRKKPTPAEVKGIKHKYLEWMVKKVNFREME